MRSSASGDSIGRKSETSRRTMVPSEHSLYRENVVALAAYIQSKQKQQQRQQQQQHGQQSAGDSAVFFPPINTHAFTSASDTNHGVHEDAPSFLRAAAFDSMMDDDHIDAVQSQFDRMTPQQQNHVLSQVPPEYFTIAENTTGVLQKWNRDVEMTQRKRYILY